MIRSVRAGAVLAAAASLLLAGAEPAPAAVTRTAVVTVPLPAGADIAAAGQFVFIAGGVNSSDVIVTNARGTPVRRLTGLPGVTAVLPSPDGRLLYAALSAGDAIVGINTATLKVTRRWRTGRGSCPATLGRSGVFLYFGGGCPLGGGQPVGRVDLRTGAVTPDVLGEHFTVAPLLEGGLRTLLLGMPMQSPGGIRSYAVSPTGALTLIGDRSRQSEAVGDSVRDVELTADGAVSWSAAGSYPEVQRWRTRGLTKLSGGISTGPYPAGVELAPDGATIAVAKESIRNNREELTVGVHRPGDAAGDRITVPGWLAPGGLAWSPDGSRLYALEYRISGGRTPRLHVLSVR